MSLRRPNRKADNNLFLKDYLPKKILKEVLYATNA